MERGKEVDVCVTQIYDGNDDDWTGTGLSGCRWGLC